MIHIIIVDDQQMFIDGIKALLVNVPEISVIGEALDGKALLKLLQRVKPDHILMDIQMPGINGIETTRIVHQRHPQIKILAVTSFNTKTYIRDILAAGATGYILKNTGQDELFNAIQALHRGESFFSAAVTQRYVGGQPATGQSGTDIPLELTEKETEVLRFVAMGLTSQEIGDLTSTSVNTVKTHRKSIFSKLRLKNSRALVKYAMDNGHMDQG